MNRYKERRTYSCLNVHELLKNKENIYVWGTVLFCLKWSHIEAELIFVALIPRLRAALEIGLVLEILGFKIEPVMAR